MKTYIVNTKSGGYRVKAETASVSFSKFQFFDKDGVMVASFNDNEASGFVTEDVFQQRLTEANDKIKQAQKLV